jgi:Raptor N-terminal CASPase like domain
MWRTLRPAARRLRTRMTGKTHISSGCWESVILVCRRKIRERMKTVSIAAVLCLNVGVDPPDVRRPMPSARKQAWVDPTMMPSNSQKIAQKVSINLQNSYLKVQPKARYEIALGHPETTLTNCYSVFKIQGGM